MEQVVLEVQERKVTGSGPAGRLRAQGLVPGIVYGRGLEPVPIAVADRDLQDLLRSSAGSNVLVDLRVPGLTHETSVAAMVREVQRDPVKHTALHVDFQWISLADRVTVQVPISFIGESPGVVEGGVIDQILYDIEVECLPTNIPEHLTLDVSGMEIRDTRQVSDLQVPEDVEVLADLEDPVVTIASPIREEDLETRVEEVEGEELLPEEEAEELEEEVEGEVEAEAEGEAEPKDSAQ